MKNLFLLSLLTISIFSSCKKDKDEELSLVGKWTLDTYTFNEYDNNVKVDTETDTGDGITFDFQSNGNVVIKNPSGTETYPYTLNGSNVVFAGDTYEIRDLKQNTVTLYYREDLGSTGDYYEILFNLKR